MASVQPRGDKFQLRVKNRLLSKPFFYTFDSHEEAKSYGEKLEALLARGIVPQDLLDGVREVSPMLHRVIEDYLGLAPVAPTDRELLEILKREVKEMRVSAVTYPWVEGYVRTLKTVNNLAPGSIRKRVESLARVMDWHLLNTVRNKSGNPLRMLPKGYSVYTEKDKALLKEDQSVKSDVQRDRRLLPSEYAACMQALSGVKREGRERALEPDPDFILLFDLILDTGMRLLEAFRLRVDQIDFVKGIVRVEGSKGHRGVIKPRNVPLKRVIRARLGAACEGKSGLVFPFWDGTPEDQRRASKRLTSRFNVMFAYAGVGDITERDLRHEACCRWFELKGADGRWVFSDVEICKIMGWSDYSMVLRYASLRGEDLSSRLLEI